MAHKDGTFSSHLPSPLTLVENITFGHITRLFVKGSLHQFFFFLNVVFYVFPVNLCIFRKENLTESTTKLNILQIPVVWQQATDTHYRPTLPAAQQESYRKASYLLATFKNIY